MTFFECTHEEQASLKQGQQGMFSRGAPVFHSVTRYLATASPSRSSTILRRCIHYSEIGNGSVQIVEVGPRDGLQNEPTVVSMADRIRLIDLLAEAGCCRIEVGSFVSKDMVPQMADTADLMQELLVDVRSQWGGRLRLSCLVAPTRYHLEQALAVRPDEIAIFVSASEGFSQRNIQCSVDESLDRYRDIVAEAKWHDIPVRGYVSCVIACPYDGPTAPKTVGRIVENLLNLGCEEVSLGDTTGVGRLKTIDAMLDAALAAVGGTEGRTLAVHFHDTHGQALHNILLALQRGITTVDSSIAGLGGCPFAKGAPGNVATEDVVATLDDLDVFTGIDLEQLEMASDYICSVLKKERRPPQKKRAVPANKRGRQRQQQRDP
jgi:hydroxymethylglutaryl-CoA lyase